MKISRTTLTGTLLTAGAALAVVVAPLAGASGVDAPSCTRVSTTATQCQSDGNAQLATAPVPQQAATVPYLAGTYGPFFGYDRGRMGSR